MTDPRPLDPEEVPPASLEYGDDELPDDAEQVLADRRPVDEPLPADEVTS